MATSINPIFVQVWRNSILNLRPTNGTNPVVCYTAGTNGGRVSQIGLASTDGTTRDCQKFLGTLLTSQSAMGTAAFATSNTISRTVGSFVTDGWKVGNQAFPSGSATLSNDKLLTITGVTSTVLTFSQTENPEAIAAGWVIYRAALLNQVSITGSSGYSNTIPTVDMLASNTSVIDPSPNRYLMLGANDALIFAAATQLTTATQWDITVSGGDY